MLNAVPMAKSGPVDGPLSNRAESRGMKGNIYAQLQRALFVHTTVTAFGTCATLFIHLRWSVIGTTADI